jgi:Ni,Fe-hydrogenase I large subunit
VERKPNSSSATTAGGKANKTGNRLEQFVEQALRDSGYKEFWNHKLHAFENRKAIGGKQYLKQLPIGSTIYGKVRKQ